MTAEAAVDWWSALCARGRCREQLLPWLLRVGRLPDRSGGQDGGDHSGGTGCSSVHAPRITGHQRGARMAASAAGPDLYRTSCIVGHLEVEDGVTPWGVRLWHCRRPGCGAGSFAPLQPATLS
jgi:hypothetical protein